MTTAPTAAGRRGSLPYRLARSAYRLCTRPVGTFRAVRTDAPHIVLTYDDGPDPVWTEQVLAELARYGASATFFVLMSRARRWPRLLAEVVAAGHEVALHGIDHQRLTRFRAAEVFRRTADGRAELEDMLGAPVRWFRPPYGAQLPATVRAVRRAGLEPVVWGPTPATGVTCPSRGWPPTPWSAAGPARSSWPTTGSPARRTVATTGRRRRSTGGGWRR